MGTRTARPPRPPPGVWGRFLRDFRATERNVRSRGAGFGGTGPPAPPGTDFPNNPREGRTTSPLARLPAHGAGRTGAAWRRPGRTQTPTARRPPGGRPPEPKPHWAGLPEVLLEKVAKELVAQTEAGWAGAAQGEGLE